MNIFWKKSMLGAVAALTLGATLASPASAQYRGGWGWGPAVGLGVLGGVAVGAAVAGANRGPYYDDGECWIERRPIYDEYGNPIGRRRVRVCR